MKLNPEELTVSSFETQSEEAVISPTTNEPTPATYCRWCPEPSFTCP